jgi:hypothetical protein
LNNGAGDFLPPVTTPASNEVRFSLRDFNNDGKLDIFSAVVAPSPFSEMTTNLTWYLRLTAPASLLPAAACRSF